LLELFRARGSIFPELHVSSRLSASHKIVMEIIESKAIGGVLLRGTMTRPTQAKEAFLSQLSRVIEFRALADQVPNQKRARG
jgi:hypothetical protein